MRSIDVLIVEEFRCIADLNALELERGDFTVHSHYVFSEMSMCEALGGQEWDIILSDSTTPHFSTMQVPAVCNRLRQKVSSIIVSEGITPESICYVMKNHCCVYLLKENLHQFAILI